MLAVRAIDVKVSSMATTEHFVRVQFERFKAFESFSLDLQGFNILVGPNNAGKSTILAAFRILAAAMRRAESRKAELVHGPAGPVQGHKVDLTAISVAEENLFYNYDDDVAASVRFELASGGSLTLYFPEHQVCYLIPDAQGRPCGSPTTFRRLFPCSIGFVPILGPVEHNEPLYEKEAARRALFNYRAARNFRNIWWHFPEGFVEFRNLVRSTWPSMDVKQPELDASHDRPRLYMYCPENRRDREIFWAGFGFQVWCQMLTHLIQGRSASIFLIDEPDIYLHSDLQRQLIALLRSLGPDILIATHSPEIVTEAEPEEIVVVDKNRRRSSRVRNADQVADVFRMLGSAINPILTQLAKTRRALFVEGGDFQILGRLARKLGYDRLAARSDFAVVPVGGFGPARMRDLKKGMEATLGGRVATAALLDRDYRSDNERTCVQHDCEEFCDPAIVHDSKEIENLLLVPSAIDRAATARMASAARRRGAQVPEPLFGLAEKLLHDFAEQKRSYVMSRYLALRRRHERDVGSGAHEDVVTQEEVEAFDRRWSDPMTRFKMIPGKDALSYINRALQEKVGVSVTPTSIIEAMRIEEVNEEAKSLMESLERFRTTAIPV
jgi:energy-coupling factor transporter ATP-binding protein EcfA2